MASQPQEPDRSEPNPSTQIKLLTRILGKGEPSGAKLPKPPFVGGVAVGLRAASAKSSPTGDRAVLGAEELALVCDAVF